MDCPSPVQLDEALHDSLHLFSKVFGYSFVIDGASGFSFTPKKPNTASATREVFQKDQPVGTLCAILFAPGDGTGDDSTYKISKIKIPDVLNCPDPRRLIPRRKDGVFVEGYFPLATFSRDATFIATGGLDELTFTDDASTQLQIGWRLGYENIWAAHQPAIFSTTGYSPAGARFGDPHAIVNRSSFYQLAGFLAINDKSALPAAENWKLPVLLQ